MMNYFIAITILFSHFSFSYILKDYNFAYSEAGKENKKIVLEIGASWCGPCLEYKKVFIPSSKIKHSYKNHFVFMDLNIDELKKEGKDNEAVKNCDLSPKNINWKRSIYKCLQLDRHVSLPIFVILDPSRNSIIKLNNKEDVSGYLFQSYSEELSFELADKIKKSISPKKEMTQKQLVNL